MWVVTIVTFETNFTKPILEVHFDTYGRYLAIVAEAYLNHVSRIIRPHGIERYHFMLLHICERSGELTQKGLCELTHRDKVSVLRAVDYLVDRGFIERRESTADRRCQILVATAAGHALVPVIHAAIEETNKTFFGDFSEEEWKGFRSSLDKLLEITRQLPDPEFIIRAEKRSADEL